MSAQDLPVIEGWDAFVESLRALAPRMLAKLPEALRADPLQRQELGRLMLESLAYNAIEAVGADGDRPVFLPMLNVILNIGQPNADTNYRRAVITPGGTYRLRGRRGTLRLAKIGQFGPISNEPAAPGSAVRVIVHDYNDFVGLQVDAEDRFDVLLSPIRPEGYDGDWWELKPLTSALVMRMVASDWACERDPTLSIERLDAPVTRPRRDAADLAQRLGRLGASTAGFALMFVDHVAQLQKDGYVNRLKIFDVSQMGALEGQFYYEGAFDLQDDEALILESDMPGHVGYASIILTNEIYETIDWYNNHSSLNASQFRVDEDSKVRFVVSARDPGVPNWLDTAGHQRGVIQGRWTDCDTQPMPTVQKIALADVRAALPAGTPQVTPQERDRIIRDRRAALQQRPLW